MTFTGKQNIQPPSRKLTPLNVLLTVSVSPKNSDAALENDAIGQHTSERLLKGLSVRDCFSKRHLYTRRDMRRNFGQRFNTNRSALLWKNIDIGNPEYAPPSYAIKLSHMPRSNARTHGRGCDRSWYLRMFGYDIGSATYIASCDTLRACPYCHASAVRIGVSISGYGISMDTIRRCGNK